MCCGPLMGSISCIKGMDTVFCQTNPGVSGNIVDSLNYYQGKGFTCTSEISPFLGFDAGTSCGTTAISQQEASGNACVATDDNGYCNF